MNHIHVMWNMRAIIIKNRLKIVKTLEKSKQIKWEKLSNCQNKIIL